jgi:hypothetical protein
MLADDVDDARARFLRVVQVGQAIGQARPEVQQRGRRAIGHAIEAIGGAGDHAFEQAEHAAHARHLVERGDEVHLRGTGVRDTKVDAAVDQGADQALGAVHGAFPLIRLQTPGM